MRSVARSYGDSVFNTEEPWYCFHSLHPAHSAHGLWFFYIFSAHICQHQLHYNLLHHSVYLFHVCMGQPLIFSVEMSVQAHCSSLNLMFSESYAFYYIYFFVYLVWRALGPSRACRGQRTTCSSQFSHGDWSQAVRLGHKWLYSLSHLTGPSPVLLNMTFKVSSCVGWDCSPVVVYLPRMCDTLDSIPVLQNK